MITTSIVIVSASASLWFVVASVKLLVEIATRKK
jgi:hypothetical protein